MTRSRWSIVVLAWIGLALGLQIFGFVCDDAYIAFRYMRNFVDGDGLIWNQAPFPPVEGYTSFSWVMLLSGLWKLTGFEPPQTANLLLFVSSCGTLALVAAIVQRLALHPSQERLRTAWVAVVLLGILSNRTFLIWSSSGLEQGFNTLLFTGWVLAMVWSRRHWAWWVCGLAVAMALTRPDGLLIWTLTGLIWAARFRGLGALQRLSGLLLGIPLLHLLWRHQTYGVWLPNTYYAKHAALWPEAGAVYFSSFVTEYALFLWLPLLWLARRSLWPARWETKVAIAGLGGHFIYYTFGVGGDHFGYRVYHHLVPWIWLLLPMTIGRLGWPHRKGLGVATGLLLSAQIIPWTHHVRTNDLAAVRARDGDPHAVSDVLPPGLHLWGLLWEVEQAYLRSHFVCIRYRAHRSYIQKQKTRYGTVGGGIKKETPGFPSIALSGVGYPGWVMPGALVIDKLGLNDPVIARSPVRRATRKMAHDRSPPPGYLGCYRPNITAKAGVIRVRPRKKPLTPDEVAACVSRFMPGNH